ncbi:hypothetical protein [Neolewinella antarctica]|uniref:Uncharacterized protein n=1 Tax=Neolewinella antarctica TaxID=442734 RepID=A0ABX0XHQ1_9BACT|nr:hypothetical protein [Neolewinella antarctica]NJC28386.1 hypothetical protein [Neolewinella antarctica]
MKLFLTTFFLFLFIGAGVPLTAQNFTKDFQSFSRKKPVTVVLKTGDKVEGDLKKVTRKKGMVTFIMIESTGGKEYNLPAAKVSQFYAAPSGIEKVAKVINFSNGEGWFDPNVDRNLINDGYLVLESVKIKGKKKTMTALLQLANPEFSNGAKVYHMPGGNKKTGSMMIPGVTGTTAYFYVQLGTARYVTLVSKVRYKKEFEDIFKGCDAVLNVDKPKWKDFSNHILTYSEACGSETK